MKFKLLLFIVVVLLASACGSSAGPAATAVPPTATPLPAWPEFTSEVGGFTVMLPSTPTEQVQSIPSAAGDISLYIYMVEEDNAAYGAMYNSLPDMIALLNDDESIKLMLDSGRDGAMANVNGIITQEEEITIDGYPGRHIVFEIPEESFPGGGDGVVRIYLVDGKMYQIIAIGSLGTLQPETLDMFFDSFRLVP